eukprot:4821308-Prymnesium_polylepis.1
MPGRVVHGCEAESGQRAAGSGQRAAGSGQRAAAALDAMSLQVWDVGVLNAGPRRAGTSTRRRPIKVSALCRGHGAGIDFEKLSLLAALEVLVVKLVVKHGPQRTRFTSHARSILTLCVA